MILRDILIMNIVITHILRISLRNIDAYNRGSSAFILARTHHHTHTHTRAQNAIFRGRRQLYRIILYYILCARGFIYYARASTRAVRQTAPRDASSSCSRGIFFRKRMFCSRDVIALTIIIIIIDKRGFFFFLS